MRNYVVIFFFCIMSTHSFATMFKPTTIKGQLFESDGIVEGRVLAIESELDSEKNIVTKVNIRVDKWLGKVEVKNEETNLYYPGGVVGDQGRLIEGAPKFKIGENVIVLTKKVNGMVRILNLGLGKFSIVRAGDKKIMINQIFPNKPNVSQMPLDIFYGLAKKVKGEKFSYRFKDKYELIDESYEIKPNNLNNKLPSRGIASISANEPVQKNKKMDPSWFVLLLGLFALGIGALRKKINEK